MESIKEVVGVALVITRLDSLWAVVKHWPGAVKRGLFPEVHPDVPEGDRGLIKGLGIAAVLMAIPLAAAVVVLVLAALGVIE